VDIFFSNVTDESIKEELDEPNDSIENDAISESLASENHDHETLKQKKFWEDGSEKCQFCSKIYATKSKLKIHQRKYHHDKIETSTNAYKCERFEYKTDVKSKNFQRREGMIFCADEQCDKFFKSIKGAYAHYEGVHIGLLNYPCDLCEKRFKSHHVWRCHVSAQHNAQQDGKVTCDMCGGCYVSISAMNHHKRTYHAETPQVFVCSFCSKTFRTRGSLREHENGIHNGSKKVTCDVCGKSLSSKTALEAHIKNKHERMKGTETKGVRTTKRISLGGYKNDLSQVRFEKQGGRFHCKEANCTKSMKTHQIAIEHHEKVHIGLSLYHCDQCDKRLTSLGGWTTHKYQDHTKGVDSSVKCEYCGKEWPSEARKRGHVMKYHKNEKKDQVDQRFVK